jgi:hypothetical protein
METNWNDAEETLIARLMAQDGLSRIDAIRRLRSSWLIGETPPPLWREGRAMPRTNPRYGTVQDAVQGRANPSAPPDFRGFEASTRADRATEPTVYKTRKPASERQARWRAKKAAQASEPVAA